MDDFNKMQSLKRRLFAMRNGAVAESLRRSGSPYRIIFGVNLPQLVEIARDFEGDATLAAQLWDNRSTRESMLLAPMIYPADKMDLATARAWAVSAPTPEVADILCHRLLKRLDFADSLADSLLDGPNDLVRYCGLRLLINRFPRRVTHAREMAERELRRQSAMTASLARMIVEEADFISDEPTCG